MNLQDALFNWLQIRIVADGRPQDGAARETVRFFEQILREDHRLDRVEIAEKDDTMIHVRYESEGRAKRQMFDREAAEKLLADIETNPDWQ